MIRPKPGTCAEAGGMRNNSRKNNAMGLRSRCRDTVRMMAVTPAYTQKLWEKKATSVKANQRLRRRVKSL
ncbi:hypothetical protein D3C73_1534710 [compost metagenome]